MCKNLNYNACAMCMMDCGCERSSLTTSNIQTNIGKFDFLLCVRCNHPKNSIFDVVCLGLIPSCAVCFAGNSESNSFSHNLSHSSISLPIFIAQHAKCTHALGTRKRNRERERECNRESEWKKFENHIGD